MVKNKNIYIARVMQSDHISNFYLIDTNIDEFEKNNYKFTIILASMLYNLNFNELISANVDM